MESLTQALAKVYSSVTGWTEYVGTNQERNQLKEELSNLWLKLPKEMQGDGQKELFIEKTTANITAPWFRHFLKTNPLGYLQKLTIPVLAINGENDTQVEYKINLNAIDAALKKGNNKHYTIKSYPRLNHLFQESTTGELDEYGKIEQTISPEVLSDITKWIKQQVKP
jgi:dipeptidyl aminopeptidase/acylaminoacyl peptidase